MLCDNKRIAKVQPIVFRKAERGNQLVSCNDGSIPRIDFGVFKDNDDGAEVRLSSEIF